LPVELDERDYNDVIGSHATPVKRWTRKGNAVDRPR
jgi:hypothetical protein